MWWQKLPILLRDRLLVRDIAEIHLLEEDDHRHLQLEHLVHLVVLLAQGNSDTLNITVMLRTVTGISECLLYDRCPVHHVQASRAV